MQNLNLDFSSFPLIETSRLTMRKLDISDAPLLYNFRTDPAVMRYLDRPLAKNVEEVEALIRLIEEGIENSSSITWGIVHKSDKRFIGTIGFWKIDAMNYRAEIGYLLDSAYHQQGLMTEAIQFVLDFGFKQINLHSVEASINPSNIASAKLLEKVGFRKEAHFKENYYYDGKFLDSVIYSLLNYSV